MVKADWQRLIQNLVAEGILHSPRVIEAMQTVSREPFLPEELKPSYAVDAPLPIGWGQTASAPHGWARAKPGETWFQS